MSKFIDTYIDLLITQYKDKPKALAHLKAILEPYEELYNFYNNLLASFDVDTAMGEQLDILGKIVVISRNTQFSTKKRFFGFDNNPNSLPFNTNETTLYPFFKFNEEFEEGVLDDMTYRLFIKAKIVKNNVKATMMDENLSSLQSAIDFLFSGKAYIVDNLDMSLTIYIDRDFDKDLLQYLKNADLIPKAQGVRIKSVIAGGENTFGFSNNPNSKGFWTEENPSYFAQDLNIT